MNGADLDQSILALINDSAEKLENMLNADVMFYHGAIHPAFFRVFRNFVETVKDKSTRTDQAIADEVDGSRSRHLGAKV